MIGVRHNGEPPGQRLEADRAVGRRVGPAGLHPQLRGQRMGRRPGHYVDADDQGRVGGVLMLGALPETRDEYDKQLRAAGIKVELAEEFTDEARRLNETFACRITKRRPSSRRQPVRISSTQRMKFRRRTPRAFSCARTRRSDRSPI